MLYYPAMSTPLHVPELPWWIVRYTDRLASRYVLVQAANSIDARRETNLYAYTLRHQATNMDALKAEDCEGRVFGDLRDALIALEAKRRG